MLSVPAAVIIAIITRSWVLGLICVGLGSGLGWICVREFSMGCAVAIFRGLTASGATFFLGVLWLSSIICENPSCKKYQNPLLGLVAMVAWFAACLALPVISAMLRGGRFDDESPPA